MGTPGLSFCAAMVLKFHASLLYFFLIQCKPHQPVCLISHKQRDVQYIIGRLLQGIPVINQKFWECHWTNLHETDDLRTPVCQAHDKKLILFFQPM